MDSDLGCPFSCNYRALENYDLLWHIETAHAEGPSPFVVDGDEAARLDDTGDLVLASGEHAARPEPLPGSLSSSAVNAGGAGGADDGAAAGLEQYAECPVDGCGEMLELFEIEYHLELHEAEAGGNRASASGSSMLAAAGRTEDEEASPAASPPTSNVAERRHHQKAPPSEAGSSSSRRDSRRRTAAAAGSSSSAGKRSSQPGVVHAWKQLFAGRPREKEGQSAPTGPPGQRRLGKAELGRFANERKMPDWLVTMLEKETLVRADGVIPVLGQLLEHNGAFEYAYLCDPRVSHISKQKREGFFCGYRNIQMLISYMNEANFPGSACFGGRIPTILELQDSIENAWDLGINTQGRIETGGIRGTRKYIGTPEAQAIFCSMGIPCECQAFKSREPGVSVALLLESVESYFQSDPQSFSPSRVRRTSLPPIYFQRPGHSLTIIGLAKTINGDKALLVFDPSFHDSPGITRLIGRQTNQRANPDLLRSYIRDRISLSRYREFEVLRLAAPRSSVPNPGGMAGN